MKLKIGGSAKVVESERVVHNGGGRKVVLVGVKLERQSRELLTWSLMKLAQPGDRVIALHVIHSSSGEQSSLLSLVKTFDSVLSVYEGFCHLRQVDLKLKVSRGPSARKILVQEAKKYDGATVVVGISKIRHPLLSQTSMAKECARKLPDNFAVIAVDNGKISFQRKATIPVHGLHRSNSSRNLISSEVNPVEKEVKPCLERRHSLDKRASISRGSTLIKKYFGCAQTTSWSDYPCDLLMKPEPCADADSDSASASVTYQAMEASSKPKLTVGKESQEQKQGWALTRRVSLPKQQQPEKAPKGKTSAGERFSSLRIQTVQPEDEEVRSTRKGNQLSNVNGENGKRVPVGNHVFPSPKQGVQSAEQLVRLCTKYLSKCRVFDYKELFSATSGFLPERMIGRGGSSCVFKGQLPNGKELAVKILKSTDEVMNEFIAEIKIVTSINHKNIISLIGFCFKDDRPILVYNLLPRGSLEESLHGNKMDATAFGWEERYKVALGVAQALDHLHNGSSETVIHRDVKSSNILLAEDFEPQLADFGLATRASNASSLTTCTDVAGTFGYLAPEYFIHGKVTEKIDVYAFGVVLLELLTGRKPIDSRNPIGQESLVLWATPLLKVGKISQLLDPILGYHHYVIKGMALAATLCIRRAPLYRPKISTVLKILQGDPDVTTWAEQQAKSTSSDFDVLDGEASPKDLQSHINTAFLDLEEDSSSIDSTEPNVSVDDYLKGRWSQPLAKLQLKV